MTLLQGQKISCKLNFNDTSRKFSYAFMVLRNRGIIDNQKQEVVEWIVKYFRYRHKREKRWADFDRENLKRSMTRAMTEGENMVKNPINLEDVLNN